MTVDELVEWIESARREGQKSGQEIGDYQVHVPCNSVADSPVEDGKVDHGTSDVFEKDRLRR